MAEVKRVSDQYKISSPSIVIDGNLTVTGSTTSVETVNSVINDNIIVLNQNEIGDGITAGTAGIEIERGSSDNAALIFNEATDNWEVRIGSSLANIRGAAPVDDNDLVTKDYVDSGLVASSPGGPLTSVQYNGGSVFSGVNEFAWNGSSLIVQDLLIGFGSISVTGTNANLTIAANGTGKIYIENVLGLDNKASDPTSELGKNMLYAKLPGNAGSGVYFSNTTATDELVSRSKAILFGLIF
jgi:hypothetical protein